MSLWHHVARVVGLSPSYWQSWWGGFGGDAGSFTFVATAGVLYKRYKCHVCWRLSLRGVLGEVKGTHWVKCHRHTTAADHEALARQHAELHPLMHAHLNPKPRRTSQ